MGESSLGHVTIGGSRLPYLELGRREGPPVVLLPGLSDGLAPLTDQAARQLHADVPLPMDEIRGIVVSHRTPATPVSTRELAADMALVLEVLLDRPAVLVGHSMGGMVAQHLAADRPELVAALVLSASSARPDETVRSVLARWDALVTAHRFQAFVHDAIEMSFTGEERGIRQRLLAEAPPSEPLLERVSRHLALSAACGTHDASDRLSAVGQPALVLAGQQDRVIPVAQSRWLAGALPQARFVSLPDLGHGFPEQDPEGYAQQVAPFVAEAVVG